MRCVEPVHVIFLPSRSWTCGYGSHDVHEAGARIG